MHNNLLLALVLFQLDQRDPMVCTRQRINSCADILNKISCTTSLSWWTRTISAWLASRFCKSANPHARTGTMLCQDSLPFWVGIVALRLIVEPDIAVWRWEIQLHLVWVHHVVEIVFKLAMWTGGIPVSGHELNWISWRSLLLLLHLLLLLLGLAK